MPDPPMLQRAQGRPRFRMLAQVLIRCHRGSNQTPERRQRVFRQLGRTKAIHVARNLKQNWRWGYSCRELFLRPSRLETPQESDGAVTYKESWCKGLHLPPVLPEKIRHSIHPPRWLFVAVLCLCLGVGASVSLFLGQDDNWDLRNYHLYTGYSGLHDRLSIDLAAACLQSWMNPLLDIPYAWLALGPFAERPRLLAAFMGLWYGLLIAVALALAWTLYDPWPTARKWAAIAFATIVGTSGAAVISQVGTTFNEIQI